MYSRGIRGAISVDANTEKGIKEATKELLLEMLDCNKINIDDIAFAIFTLTSDLNAAFPAKFAREDCGFKYVPMMCYTELDVKNSLRKCLRILLNVNTNLSQNEIKHVYLKDASVLRKDL